MERYKPENKDFPRFLGFRFEPYTQKRKLGNQMTTNSKWFIDVVQIAFYPICLGRIKLFLPPFFTIIFKAYEAICTNFCDS